MTEFNLTFEDAIVEAIRGKIVRNNYFSKFIYRFYDGCFQYKRKSETDFELRWELGWEASSFSAEERIAEWAIFQELKTAAEKIDHCLDILKKEFPIRPTYIADIEAILKELKEDLE